MKEQDIEQLLKNTEPRKASPAFKDKLLSNISEAERNTQKRVALHWRPLMLAAAATLVITLTLWHLRDKKSATGSTEVTVASQQKQIVNEKPDGKTDIFEPVTAKTLLVSYKEEPLQSDDRIFNRHQYRLVDCMEWINKKNGNRFRVMRPRNETVILCSNTH